MVITFVLSGSGISGGVRVTVDLANLLISRGHRVRIAIRRHRPNFRGILDCGREWRRDWIHRFAGKVERYSSLERLRFDEKEVVVAVGSWTVRDVYELPNSIIKLRYCHGLPTDQPDIIEKCWRLPMPTIVVSEELKSQIQNLTGEPPLDVVPNGISPGEYYVQTGKRLAVGGIYIPGQIKAGEVLIAVFRRLQILQPEIPLVAFGPGSKPRSFPALSYTRLPSVTGSRSIYNRCKVWVLTSRREGLPAPILEAMSCGAAVVTTAFPTVGYLVNHEQNGLITPIDDVDALTEAVLRLLGDNVLREEITIKAKETAAKFSWDCACNKFEGVLKKVCETKMENK